jgi:hypothetical protein
MAFRTAALACGLPVAALVSHELTHVIVSRIISPISLDRVRYLPFRIEIAFTEQPSSWQLRVVALAPLLVGLSVATLALIVDFAPILRRYGDYYLPYLAGLNLLLYSIPSPADLRLAMAPGEHMT